MREIALSVQVKNREIIDYLQKNIELKIDFCSPIVTNYCDNNFCHLLFACDENFISSCEDAIRDVIIDYIETVYKVEYLKSKIHNPLKDNLAFNAYIKVLSLFDRVTDENALRKIILFNQTFFVDSFLDFRLTPLKKHWDNLATLSSDNMMLFNSSTFLDVIRFLLNAMDSLVYKVKIVCNGETFSIYNMKNKNAKIKKVAECKNSTDMITNVLNACPNYIDVYLNTQSNNEEITFLSNIFANRLKIFSRT